MTASTPLHVAYLVQQFPPEVGAGPARVTEMALRWQASGARVTVLTAFPSRSLPGRAFGEGDPAYRRKLAMEEDHQGLRVLRSWAYAAAAPGFLPTLFNNTSFMMSAALHALARLGPVDVLIASSPPFFPHMAGAFLARARKIPLVLEVRDLWPDYLVAMGMLKPDRRGTKALFAVERRLLTRAQRVVVVTESFRRRVVEKGADAARVEVISNGVDGERYHPSDEVPPLPSMERREGGFVAGYLGTFGVSQALGSLVDAAALLAKEDPTIRIVLAGDGLERERVTRHARGLDLPNLSIEGSIPKDRTRAFYNACDACLVPLAPLAVLQETVPSKIFEAMACARPVLASLGGEGREIMMRSGGGVVVPPGDPRALADALKRLKAMPPAERAEMGARGRRFVEHHYSREVLAARYLDLLHRTAGRAPLASGEGA
jgi:colanic acid biosynthesis glycosyl transferase WcaI